MRPYLDVDYLHPVLCRAGVTGFLGPADTTGRKNFFRTPQSHANMGETSAKKRVSGFAPDPLEIVTEKSSQNGTEKGGDATPGDALLNGRNQVVVAF